MKLRIEISKEQIKVLNIKYLKVMTFKQLFHKLFIGGIWYVGYRDKKDNQKSRYEIVLPPKGQWLADPFLYEFDGRHYLFVEQYFTQKHRAGIGVYEFVDGVPVNNEVVIENKYHMSYPCVFYHNGNHYMIPESSANNTIDLYVAESFPYGWKHDAILLTGEKYVDSTVYKDGDNLYLLSYKKDGSQWKLVVFLLDIDNKALTRISEKVYPDNTGRPAGFIYNDKGLFRPSQDCSLKYGEALIINKIDSINNDGYNEHPVSRILSSDIKCPINIHRVHTINHDSQYEVVDLFEEKFDLFHGWKILKRAYL